MIVYCIIESGWGGSHYSFDDVYLYPTEAERDAEYGRLLNVPAFKKGDIILDKCETELNIGEFEGEIVKDINNSLKVSARIPDGQGFKFGDRVKVQIIKNDEHIR